MAENIPCDDQTVHVRNYFTILLIQLGQNERSSVHIHGLTLSAGRDPTTFTACLMGGIIIVMLTTTVRNISVEGINYSMH